MYISSFTPGIIVIRIKSFYYIFMFSVQSHILIFSLPFIFSQFRVHGSSLDCKFNWTFCCWKNKGDGSPWQIYRGKSHDDKNRSILYSRLQDDKLSNHFFLATSVTSEQRFSSDWTSCVICSKTGLFKVLVRAYQTPKTRIKLCWKFANGENSIYRYCAFLRNWKSSDYASKYFTVTPKRPIQFYIKLHNHGQSIATAVIDSIKVVTEECHLPLIRPKHRQVKLYSIQPNEEKEEFTTKVVTSQRTISKLSSTKNFTIPSNSNSPFILSDVFGDAFAQFLEDDSDGLIVEGQKARKDDIKSSEWLGRNNAKQDNVVFVTTTLAPELPFNFNFLKCNTAGGCLFDQSMCSYQNSPMSLGSTFQRVRLHDQNFMQALTRPNTIAVLETNTTFTEDHKIVFDVLEFTEGQRLYGCCYNTKLDADETLLNIRKLLGGKRPSELFCPFATAAYSTPLIWRTERFTCPQGTEKILFMCENNGKINGACAMDNIRIHKILDVLEMEPCQKNIIAFS
uniref:MAM domain-containing protein n=2 Tax=Wuchereria bancrofti TaxID=6293 RepID=A0A1I8EYT5_WUCBA